MTFRFCPYASISVNGVKIFYDFFEFDKEIKDYSGNVFELLVEIILRKLYPQYSFTRTSYSHDGGKDFYAINGDTSIWAEAKEIMGNFFQIIATDVTCSFIVYIVCFAD